MFGEFAPKTRGQNSPYVAGGSLGAANAFLVSGAAVNPPVWRTIQAADLAGLVVSSLAGTASQIAVSAATGAVTLSLPNNVIIPTPASGTALTVNAIADGQAIAFAGATNTVNTYVATIESQAAAGLSSGLYLSAGTNSSDSTLTVYNAAQSHLYAYIAGDGSGQLGYNGTGSTLTFSSAGAVKIPISPLVANVTQVYTGLAAYKPSDTTAANSTLTADSTLTLTFNETGKYAIEIWLSFYEATVGTGGFQFDLNSGTATVANLLLGVTGFSTSAITNAAVTSVATATVAGSVTTSSTSPSWFLAKGSLSITGTGTLAIRWAQNTLLGADPTTLKAGSYFQVSKIAS